MISAFQIAEDCRASVERDLAQHGIRLTERDRTKIECFVAGIVNLRRVEQLAKRPRARRSR